MSVIWCLFSIDNACDQPDNNLVFWWPNKPSAEMLYATCVGCSMEAADRLLTGEEVRFDDADFRLREVESGVRL